ncbi:MAG TPA: hypothetical protein VIM11_07015 [Tepidisphaeraceae bacterium]
MRSKNDASLLLVAALECGDVLLLPPVYELGIQPEFAARLTA